MTNPLIAGEDPDAIADALLLGRTSPPDDDGMVQLQIAQRLRVLSVAP